MGVDLTKGRVKSCGCLRHECQHPEKLRHPQKDRAENTWDLTGDYGIGYDNNGNKFLFDLEDYDRIKKYYWSKDHGGYFYAILYPSRKCLKLHRFIMNLNFGDERQVDHIKTENKFDNRKCNLRIVNQMQNGRNQKLHSNNTSGRTGVYWMKDRDLWTANICINYNTIWLGAFNNKQDAIKAREEAEKKYYGEYSYLASQKIANQYEVKSNDG